ncbi:MAG: DUF4350 domain-containing protein [Candidatus Neomarinimicrobiota bacterium]
MTKLWRGSIFDGLGILFLGWLYGVSIVKFDAIAWILIAAGAVVFILSLIGNWRRFVSSIEDRRALLSLNAFIVIILVIGIIAMLNYLSIRHSWRMDATAQKEFSLSRQTRSILRNLEDDVKLIAFVDESQFSALGDRLREYAYYSGKFEYELIDPISEPERIREFFGPDKQYLDLPTLLLKTSLKDEQINSVLEEDVTNALIKVTREEKHKIYLTQGHGEKTLYPDQPGMEGYQFARESLEKQYFDVEELNLYEKDEVPSDGTILVVAGPMKRFAENEVSAIGKFLDGGGNLLALIDPEVESGLEALVRDWNIQLNDDMVLESHSSFVLSATGLSRRSNVSAAPTSAEYGEHKVTKNFRFATSFIKTRSLDVVDEEQDSLETTPLVYTSRSSWGETDLNALASQGKASLDETDFQGPTIVAVAVEKTRGKKGRLIVVGDSDFASDVYIQQAPGNLDFFLNMVSWLAEQEDLISVRPKDPENRPLTMTMRQQKLTLFFLIILLPLVTVRWGIHVYTKRS